MALVDQISADIKSAMLAREKEKLEVLRDIKSKIMLEATAGTGEVTEATEAKIVLKLYKQRTDTYDLYKRKAAMTWLKLSNSKLELSKRTYQQ